MELGGGTWQGATLQCILEPLGDVVLVVDSETPSAAMKDPGSSAADTPSSGEDQSSLPSSGAQNNREGTEGAQSNASVPNGPACSGIPRACEGPEEEGALVEKAAPVEKPPHDPEQEGEDEDSQFLELYPF